MQYVRYAAALAVVAGALFAPAVYGQGTGNHLTNEFTGTAKCLDIVNDGTNDKIQMADCGNFTGQAWRMVKAGDGAVRLMTEFTGTAKCLDVINDGKNNLLHMDSCGDYSGQLWLVRKTNTPGQVRLKTEFTGENKCLDVVNDGRNNKLQMADCGNFSGQFWRVQAAR